MKTAMRTAHINNKVSTGFTLLELLVVMVIIGLLASYVGPKYFSQLGKSETKTAKAQIEALSKAVDTFRLDMGRYPTREEGLSVLNKAADGESKWQGPYLAKGLPKDPWGDSYHYDFPGVHGDYDIWTLGSDGIPGGDGSASDVGNWQ